MDAKVREDIVARNDALLAALVNVVNDFDGVEIGITLNVGGSIVSGLLIGIGNYYEGVATSFRENSSNPEIAEVFANLFDNVKEQYIEHNKEEPDASPTLIHLKNARFIGENRAIPTNTGVWWRGRLSAVDGFTFGNLTVE